MLLPMRSGNEIASGPKVRLPVIGLCLSFVSGTWMGLSVSSLTPAAILPCLAAFAALVCLWVLLWLRERRVVARVSATDGRVAPSWISTALVHTMVAAAAWLNATCCAGPEAGRLSGSKAAGSIGTWRRGAIAVPQSIGRKAAEWQNRSVRLLTAGIEECEEESSIIVSLVVGRRRFGARDLFAVFARTGTLHIFAVSGAHVMTLAAVAAFCLRVMRVPRRLWAAIASPVVAIYTLITGLQPSALRACLMSVLYLGAPLVGRKPAVFPALAASAIAILAISPRSMMMPGFQLSYLAMLGILVLYPMCSAAIPVPGRIERDSLQADPDPRWKRTLIGAINSIHQLFAVSLAAWIATAPVTARYFNLVSPIGLIGNLVAVPCASLMILTGCLSFLSALIHPSFPIVFNNANLAFAWLLSRFMKALDSIPFGCIRTPSPPWWMIAACYALSAIAVFEWRRRRE